MSELVTARNLHEIRAGTNGISKVSAFAFLRFEPASVNRAIVTVCGNIRELYDDRREASKGV